MTMMNFTDGDSMEKLKHLDDFDIVIDDMDDFNDLVSGDSCILSKTIVTHLEWMQRKGFTRCKPEDYVLTILVKSISQEIILTVDKNRIIETLDLNLKVLERHEHYRYCARVVRLKKRIEQSEKRRRKKYEETNE